MLYDGIALHFPPNVGIEFSSNIHWSGMDGFEPNVWRVLRELIPHSQCFIDVGAHIGFYAVLAQKLKPAINLFAFEPVPDAFVEAKKFFAANRTPTGGRPGGLRESAGESGKRIGPSWGVFACRSPFGTGTHVL